MSIIEIKTGNTPKNKSGETPGNTPEVNNDNKFLDIIFVTPEKIFRFRQQNILNLVNQLKKNFILNLVTLVKILYLLVIFEG